MKNKNLPENSPKPTQDEDENAEGYPLYPPSEDIFEQGQIVSDIDPDDVTHEKAPNEEPGVPNEKDFEDDMTGEDLDIPGAELDDEMEEIGSEDEENNLYS